MAYLAALYPILCSAFDKGNNGIIISVVESCTIRILGAQILGSANMKEHRSMGMCGHARA